MQRALALAAQALALALSTAGSGAFAAKTERPAVSRRLLDEFMAERDSLPLRNAQRLWYQHPGARP